MPQRQCVQSHTAAHTCRVTIQQCKQQ
jgi:hypothetical protein